jgi:DNA-binding NarL/FixJ family response regulator
MTPKQVLVADDRESMRNAVCDLRRGSFDVVGTASDGKAALERILELEPDLGVLDVSMTVRHRSRKRN